MQEHAPQAPTAAARWLAVGCVVIGAGVAAWWAGGPDPLRTNPDAYGTTTLAGAADGTHWLATDPVCASGAAVTIQDVSPVEQYGSGEVAFGTREVFGELGDLTGHRKARPPGWQDAVGSDVVERCGGPLGREVVVRMRRTGDEPLMVAGLVVRYADAVGRTRSLTVPASFALCGEGASNHVLPEDTRSLCAAGPGSPD